MIVNQEQNHHKALYSTELYMFFDNLGFKRGPNVFLCNETLLDKSLPLKKDCSYKENNLIKPG